MSQIKNTIKNNIFTISISVCIIATIVLFFFGKLLVDVPHLPDTGASWYYWKLPERNFISSFTAWLLYGAHQLTVWYLIYKIIKLPKEEKNKFGKYNYYLLFSNLFFVLMHYVQTYIWYDGLAQDVSVWSSQISVIFMLVIILIMENRRRGLFFGKKVKLPKKGVSTIAKYHGLYIAWALVYTFWYHPMEGTPGHLVGFLYMFFLFVQMSFANTKVHNNRIWTFVLEILVLFHGTTVAISSNNSIWTMFFFGFGFLLVVTQIHGLGLSKNSIFGITIAYIIGALVVYSIKGIGNVHQITWIPIIEYGLVFLVPWILEIGIKVISLKNKQVKHNYIE